MNNNSKIVMYYYDSYENLQGYSNHMLYIDNKR